MKKSLLVLVFSFVVLLSCSCGHDNYSGDNQITDTVSSEPQVTLTPPLPATSKAITWVMPFATSMTPSEEEQWKINKYLYDCGYDCTIKFERIGLVDNEGNDQWITEYIDQNGIPDVVTVGYWSTIDGPPDYAKRCFYSLNEYLHSEQGYTLYEAFAPIEWMACNVDGNVYTIPWMIGKDKYNRGTYLLINEKYDEYFQDFDGTYVSLHTIYNRINDDSLRIVVKNAGSIMSANLLYACMGYETYHGRLPYDPVNKCFVDFADPENGVKLGATVDLLYGDMEAGILWNPMLEEGNEPEQVLAYLVEGICVPKEGFKRVPMAEDPYDVLLGGAMGIYKDSEQKELALQIVSACFADPEIATLIYPAMQEKEWWNERRELLQTEKSSELTGFIPKTDAMMNEAYNAYEQEYNNLLSTGMGLFNTSTGRWMLRKNFSFDAWNKNKAFASEKISRFIGELNRQLSEHSLVE